jgi:hypothetical protein
MDHHHHHSHQIRFCPAPCCIILTSHFLQKQFLTTDMVEGRWLLWAHDGMFLPVIGLFLYSVALGKDPLG